MAPGVMHIGYTIADFGEFVGKKHLTGEVEHDIRIYRIWKLFSG
jgi:hypothetical protein